MIHKKKGPAPNSLMLFLFVMLIFPDAFSQEVFQVGEVKTVPGEKKSGYIIVPAGFDSGEVKVPVTVVNGTKDGPVLALVAGCYITL